MFTLIVYCSSLCLSYSFHSLFLLSLFSLHPFFIPHASPYPYTKPLFLHKPCHFLPNQPLIYWRLNLHALYWIPIRKYILCLGLWTGAVGDWLGGWVFCTIYVLLLGTLILLYKHTSDMSCNIVLYLSWEGLKNSKTEGDGLTGKGMRSRRRTQTGVINHHWTTSLPLLHWNIWFLTLLHLPFVL